jgi:hypothetical protein
MSIDTQKLNLNSKMSSFSTPQLVSPILELAPQKGVFFKDLRIYNVRFHNPTELSLTSSQYFQSIYDILRTFVYTDINVCQSQQYSYWLANRSPQTDSS